MRWSQADSTVLQVPRPLIELGWKHFEREQ